MPNDNLLRFGEDFKFYIDTANNWATPVWVEAKCADELSGDDGVLSAEFPCRGEPEVGHRRSKRRDPSLTLSIFVKPGDAAYERFLAAAEDNTNAGTEIIHTAIVDGDIATAGNKMWETDYVIVSSGREYPTSEGAMIDIELRHAADSTNVSASSVTS